jgi:hypothetical protein
MYIRQAQLQVFQDSRRAWLVDEILAHVTTLFAPVVAQIGPDHARRAIEGALERAAAYRIALERDLFQFVNFVFVFGDGFPYAPQFGWARRILDDPAGGTAATKLQRIRVRASEILAERALAELDGT